MERSDISESFSVSRMTLEDLSFVLETQRELNLSFWSLEDYRNELQREESIALVALKNNQQKGFIISRLIMSEDALEIYNIGVQIKDQRKGFGETLLKKLIDICLEKNIETVWLETRKSNFSAVKFYTKFGFQIVGERKDFYQFPKEDAYVLKLKLEKKNQP